MLNQIRYFMAVVETGSFTRAAEKCHISQSAISQQIQSLERELGVKLIEREKRKITLTRPGQYFFRKMSEHLADLDRTIHETKKLAMQNQEQIRLGILKGFHSKALFEALSSFSREYPEVQVSITEGNHEELYEKIRTNQLDLLISDQRRAFSQIYHNHFLRESPMFIEMSEEHPLKDKDFIDISDIKDFPLILITSEDQKGIEEAYFRDSHGVEGDFLFAQNVDIARFLLTGAKTLLCTELREDKLPSYILRKPFFRSNEPLTRKYHAFWKRSRSGFYLEDFVDRLESSFFNYKKN